MGVYMRFTPCLPRAAFRSGAAPGQAASFSLTQHIFLKPQSRREAGGRGGGGEGGDGAGASMIYLVAGKTKDLGNELAITTQHEALLI